MEPTDKGGISGWLLYDADCRVCSAMARRCRGLLASRRLELVPLQAPWVRARLGLPEAELLAEMRLLAPSGQVFGGADALTEVSRRFWWAWPLWLLAHVPPVMAALRAAYRWVARNRECGGACGIAAKGRHPATPIADIAPLVALPTLAWMFQSRMEPWVFMWAMACALFAGSKWLSYRGAVRRGAKPGIARSFGYLFLWPGMDAAEFFGADKRPRPAACEYLWIAAKLAFGALLVWRAMPALLPRHPLVAAWVGMIGFIFLVHFGLLTLIALAWQQAGVSATPLMLNPARSASLAEFWGRRWNTGFSELAFQFVYRPLRRKTAPGKAMFLVFLVSGLIHDLVISVPARAGYGLPTLYFLIQAMGMAVERSCPARAMGLGQGLRGWAFTLLFTAGPAYWLFHPAFVKAVVLPMFSALGAA